MYLFIQQIFMERLLFARHYSRHLDSQCTVKISAHKERGLRKSEETDDKCK